MKQHKVVEEDWDYLIVLDACRYDFFEKVYQDYLKGDLEKRESKGSSTPEWASKVFQGSHDIAYFSSNPFINDVGLSLNEIDWGSSCDYDWSATNHISDIVDVWHEGWDDELSTVRPEKMNEVVRDNFDKIESAERTVIHYMQPHAPYISNGKGRKTEHIRKSFEEAKEDGKTEEDSGIFSPVSQRIRPKIEEIAENSSLAMKAGMWLELDASSLVSVGKNGTKSTVENYYEENLRLVLEHVRDLINELDGKVVVTSDHGEAFGEQGVWEHHVETHIPSLIEVPWLEVEATVEE